MLGVLRNDAWWAGKSGAEEPSRGEGETNCPRFGGDACQSGECKAFRSVIFIQRSFFLVLVLLLYFFLSVQLFVFSDRVRDLRQEIRYLDSRSSVVLMVSVPEPAPYCSLCVCVCGFCFLVVFPIPQILAGYFAMNRTERCAVSESSLLPFTQCKS